MRFLKLEKQFVRILEKLFRHFADNINLVNKNILCYAKDINTESDSKIFMKRLESNHEYNAVKLNNK